jgi:hypothetical protein
MSGKASGSHAKTGATRAAEMRPKYADLADLPEADRIAIIGRTAELGQRVGFFVVDDATADRYIAQLLQRYTIEVVDRRSDVVRHTVFVRIQRRMSATN